MKLTKAFFEDIRGLIHSARTTVARGVDVVQVYTNFEIGRRIVEQEQKGKGRAAYGQEVVRALAERLTDEFGRGYGASSLEYMRKFFLIYQDRIEISQSVIGKLGEAGKSQSVIGKLKAPGKGQSAVGQFGIAQSLTAQLGRGAKSQSLIAESAAAPIFQSLTGKSQSLTGKLGDSEIGQPPTDASAPPRPFTLSWTHYIFLLGIKNSDERSFYEIESAAQDWTVRELKRQFDSSLYERLALSRDKKGIRKLAQEGQIVANVADLLKEPLVLEFLGLPEQARYSESDLETALIDHLEHFLLELGKGFLFEARQRRFTFDGEHFFVDLVFYHRLLRSYVLIDLKLGRLTHQNLGQMLMYVNTFDREIKLPEENPTIGIVLCRQKNKAIVEITLPKDSHIHAREYQLYLPSKEVLQRKLIEWGNAVRVENE